MKESQIEEMLKAAAARLNMSPDQLKNAASSGDVNSILSKLDSSSVEKIKNVMSNKQLTDSLIEKFNKGK